MKSLSELVNNMSKISLIGLMGLQLISSGCSKKSSEPTTLRVYEMHISVADYNEGVTYWVSEIKGQTTMITRKYVMVPPAHNDASIDTFTPEDIEFQALKDKLRPAIKEFTKYWTYKACK